MFSDKFIIIKEVNRMHEEHKRLVEAQGRKISWITKQLDCSYSLIYKYLNGHCSMADEKVRELDMLLKVVQR